MHPLLFLRWRTWLLQALAFLAITASGAAVAEGSRQLHPADYPTAGSRSNLDLQPPTRYMDRVVRRTFLYVYADAGEYILLGSSNIGSGGDVGIYTPRDFGVPGDEPNPGAADFTCTAGTSLPGDHYSGPGVGEIAGRAQELAGPHSADGSNLVSGGFQPCAFQAAQPGIYGVLFTVAPGEPGPNGQVSGTRDSGNSVAAWDVTVRASAVSTEDIDGRLFTYAFNGFTGGNNRPVFSTLYYTTRDGYRYRQDLRGLDPNGYALYGNTFGFLDDNVPLYRTLRGDEALVTSLPPGVSAQAAQYPIFFSDIQPGGSGEAGAERVLTTLGIPLVPPSPQISEVVFEGTLGGAVTATATGGTFSFFTTDTVSYQIVISRDGVDYDPANPVNRMLTGIAFSGAHQVDWDGLDNNGDPFPASPTPYGYRARGRNGEVHFPIIDAENNGNPSNPAIPGGGPTITRLNGTDPGDTTVFFDDRGYVTLSGDAIGERNGSLCPPGAHAAADPAVSLTGVDSSTSYRLWQFGRNRNRDCRSDAGWGDAKAVNLWTYFLTPERAEVLEIREFRIDVGTAVSVVDTAEAGNTVQGSFSFYNSGAETAPGLDYSMRLSPGLTAVAFGNLPVGATASYDSATGDVTLAGFPSSLDSGDSIPGMNFSYTAPVSGPVLVTTGISTTAVDEYPDNDTADASTGVGAVDVETAITGAPSAASTGATVQASILFANRGSSDALDVTYVAAVGVDSGGTTGYIPTDVIFTSLPSGVTAVHDSATGQVTFTGLPAILVQGEVISISFSYTGPDGNGASVPVSSTVQTSSSDAVPSNNVADAFTVFSFPPTAALDVTASASCGRNAPTIDYTVVPVDFVPSGLATIEFVGSDGNVVESRTGQPLAGSQLWPGASVDASGEGNGWPGRVWTGTDWSEVPSTVRPELTLRITVNPTAEVSVTYPPNCGPAADSGSGGAVRPIPVLPGPLLLLLIAAVGGLGMRFRGR